MSTLQLENIKHPDASGNALELASDGTIISRGSVSKYGAIVTNARGDGIVTRSSGEGTPSNWVSYHHGLDFNGHGITSGAISARGDYMSMSSNWYIEDSTAAEWFKVGGYPATNYYQSNGQHVFQRSTATPVADTAANMTNTMVLSNQGHVTTPSQPKFYGYMTGGAAQATSTETILIMDTVPVNVGSHYNTSNGRFTAPISGWYHFTLAVYWETSTSYTRTRINVNGNQKWYTISPSQGPHTERAAGELYLSAGDYVDARIQPTNATDYYRAEAHTSFAGYLIG